MTVTDDSFWWSATPKHTCIDVTTMTISEKELDKELASLLPVPKRQRGLRNIEVEDGLRGLTTMADETIDKVLGILKKYGFEPKRQDIDEALGQLYMMCELPIERPIQVTSATGGTAVICTHDQFLGTCYPVEKILEATAESLGDDLSDGKPCAIFDKKMTEDQFKAMFAELKDALMAPEETPPSN